jgi:hypothetical protein
LAPSNHWLVWAHQDVYLPLGWDLKFASALQEAVSHWPNLAVAGVYGVSGFEQKACAIPFLSGAGQASYRPLADSVSDCFLCFSLGGLRWFSI